jgi:AcrR family transcriptional regulator
MGISQMGLGGRAERRRQQTIHEALEHALAVMAERGVGGLTVSEVARRMGMRPPSLYKYFPSLHALYDALFAAGVASHAATLAAAALGADAGVGRLRVLGRATVRWATEHPALAQLLFWRPVPDFEPSAAAFAASQQGMAQVRSQLAIGVARGQLCRSADSEDAVRLLTVLLSGLISQQLANQPRAPFDDGIFARLTDRALDMFFHTYAPDRRP